jgi:hypothetical protein
MDRDTFLHMRVAREKSRGILNMRINMNTDKNSENNGRLELISLYSMYCFINSLTRSNKAMFFLTDLYVYIYIYIYIYIYTKKYIF